VAPAAKDEIQTAVPSGKESEAAKEKA